MDELEEKRAAAQKLLLEISGLEEKKRLQELWPVWKGRERTYWKYRNCYSCPQSDADYWWKHRRISNVTPDGHMDILEFQIDKDGRLDVHEMTRVDWMMQTDGWMPSTEGEWREAALAAQAIVGKLLT